MRLTERQLGHCSIQLAAIRSTGSGLQEKDRARDDRSGGIAVRFPTRKDAVRHIVPLLGILGHEMVRHSSAIRPD